MPVLTKDICSSLSRGAVVYHATLDNADKSPVRARVNGKMQERKRTGVWRLPMKHGFRDCFDINDQNIGEWFTTEDEAYLYRQGWQIIIPTGSETWEISSKNGCWVFASGFANHDEALTHAKRHLTGREF